MLFKNKDISYSDVIVNDFVFIEHNVPESFTKYVFNLDFKDNKEDEIRYKIRNASGEIKEKIKDLVLTLPVDHNIKKAIFDFRYDINRMQKGESVPMHNETRLISPFEICFWLTKTDDFEGRDFIIEKNNERKLIKPYTGLFCFINTLIEDSFHGVSPLITDTEIITITGGLGNKFDYDKKY
jgi:hypothetical protein